MTTMPLVDDFWMPASAAPPLDSTSLHLWRASLEVDEARGARLFEILSGDERARAGRYHRDIDRRRFVAARGHLRVLLASYCTCGAEEIRFDATIQGKPVMHPVAGSAGVSFNVSHAGSLAVYAIARIRQVGVDVESVDNTAGWHGIARRFFAPEETSLLDSLPDAERVEAFLAAWTRKEAYAKACGGGLRLPLDRIRVTFAPIDRPALIATPDGNADAARWSLRAFHPAPGYIGAVVAEGREWRMEQLALEVGTKTEGDES